MSNLKNSYGNLSFNDFANIALEKFFNMSIKEIQSKLYFKFENDIPKSYTKNNIGLNPFIFELFKNAFIRGFNTIDITHDKTGDPELDNKVALRYNHLSESLNQMLNEDDIINLNLFIFKIFKRVYLELMNVADIRKMNKDILINEFFISIMESRYVFKNLYTIFPEEIGVTFVVNSDYNEMISDPEAYEDKIYNLYYDYASKNKDKFFVTVDELEREDEIPIEIGVPMYFGYYNEDYIVL